MEISVGGAILSIPDGASPEAVRAAIEHFRTTKDFDSVIDKKSGAPARVRALVGGAQGEDKLNNLRRFYPDAVPHGDDNFVFTDPGTGRPTLYNPTGMDIGDVASVSREITQSVFATGGAIMGAATGGPPGAAMGAGAGSAVGGQLYDVAARYVGGAVNTQGAARRAVDAGVDFLAGAAGQRAGDLLAEGVKSSLVGAKAAARHLVDAFSRLRISAPAGAVSGSRTVQTIEKAIEATPSGSSVMQKQAEKILDQTKAAVDRLAGKFGQAQTTQGAGEVIKRAAQGAAERFGFRQAKLYDEAFDLVGADTPVAINAISALRASMEDRLSLAPQSLKPALQGAIRQLEAIEDDAVSSGGGIAFSALREVRTMIGRDLDSPVLAGSTGSQNAAMRQIYAALTEDMSAAAQSAGSNASHALKAADRYTRQFMTTALKMMEKIDNFDADEKAFRFAIQSARDGGTVLQRMRQNFLPEEWDIVAASVLKKLGAANPGAQDAAGEAFSVGTFLSNWNRLAPEAKAALFGGNRYKGLAPELDDLVKVIQSLKGAEAVANTSNTARALTTITLMQALGGAFLGTMAGGDQSSAITGAAGALVAPRVAAKLITNPAFVKWLVADVTPNGIAAHIGRLAAISAADPGIKDEIDQYVKALRATTGE